MHEELLKKVIVSEKITSDLKKHLLFYYIYSVILSDICLNRTIRNCGSNCSELPKTLERLRQPNLQYMLSYNDWSWHASKMIWSNRMILLRLTLISFTSYDNSAWKLFQILLIEVLSRMKMVFTCFKVAEKKFITYCCWYQHIQYMEIEYNCHSVIYSKEITS